MVNAINAVPGTGRKALGSLVLFAAADYDCTVNGVQALGQPDFGGDGEQQPAGASCSCESTSA